MAGRRTGMQGAKQEKGGESGKTWGGKVDG